MKLYIEENEYYPFYDLQTSPNPYTVEIDVPDDTYKVWKGIMEEFDTLQEELRKLHNNNNENY